MHYSFLQIEPFLLYIPFVVREVLLKGQKDQYDTLEQVWYVVGVLIILLYLRFVSRCINQISSSLGIYCFSIQKRKKD